MILFDSLNDQAHYLSQPLDHTAIKMGKYDLPKCITQRRKKKELVMQMAVAKNCQASVSDRN